ncbi:MAG: TolC family protein [Candidatus Berkiella sp.]
MRPLLVVILVFATIPISAKPLDLPQAIHIALENNLELKFARFDEELRLHELKILRQKFSPQLFFNASLTVHHETYFEESFDEKKVHTYPSLKMQTPYGTQIELFTEQNIGYERYQHSKGAALRFSVEQPLLQGRSKVVNTWEIYNASILNDIQQLLFAQAKDQVIYQVIIDYNALQLCAENIKLHEYWLANATQFYENMQAKEQSGRVAKNDLHAALLQVKRAMSHLTQAQFEYSQAKRKFLEELHITDENLSFIPNTIDTEPVLNRQVVINDVMANDIESKVLSLNKERVKQQLLVAKDSKRPDLRLRGDWTLGRYHVYGEKADFGSDENVFGYPFIHDNGNYTAQILLNIPLSNKSQQYHQILAARSEIEKIEYESHYHQLRIKNFALNLLEQMEVKKRQSELAKESLQLAKQNYEDALEKLEAGRSSLFELVGYQERLLNAQIASMANQIAYYDSITNLELSRGCLSTKWVGTA